MTFEKCFEHFSISNTFSKKKATRKKNFFQNFYKVSNFRVRRRCTTFSQLWKIFHPFFDSERVLEKLVFRAPQVPTQAVGALTGEPW
jgi:hypothetical protein